MKKKRTSFYIDCLRLSEDIIRFLLKNLSGYYKMVLYKYSEVLSKYIKL